MGISEKAMMGRDGFLFLNGRDSNNLVDHLQGKIAVLPSAHQVHQANRTAIRQLEVPFLGIIVPEAHCLYPEMLPEGMVPPVPIRPVYRVLDDMAEGYVYPLEILAAYRAAGGTAYSGRDSHWTQLAALEAYKALRGRIGRNQPLDLAFDPSIDPETGDLAISSRDQAVATERLAQVRTQLGYRTLFASRILNHGNIMVLHNPKGRGRCLAFGTSFSGRLVPVYASDFEEVVFCYGTTIDPFMVDLVQPDYVISELPERFLHFPALNIRGSTLVGLLLGLNDQKDISRTQVANPTAAPEGLRALLRLLSGCANLAMGKASHQVLGTLETYDMDLALRVALLEFLLARPVNKHGLRLLLSGQFYNRSVLGMAFRMVDTGEIGLREAGLIPDSENGLLVRVRLFLRAGLPAHARAALSDCLTRYGVSPEACYFTEYFERFNQGVRASSAELLLARSGLNDVGHEV